MTMKARKARSSDAAIIMPAMANQARHFKIIVGLKVWLQDFRQRISRYSP
jgi:hypothetical protein